MCHPNAVDRYLPPERLCIRTERWQTQRMTSVAAPLSRSAA
jgi:hypothetical protein